jgi:hypothetical protein
LFELARGYFSGSNSTPTIFNGTQLHFSGAHILEAVVRDVSSKHGLNQATDVIVGADLCCVLFVVCNFLLNAL